MDAQPRTIIHKEICDTQERHLCPISRVRCLFSLSAALSQDTTLCYSLTFTQIGSLNFLLELKIHTRGQYVSYKLQKTVV